MLRDFREDLREAETEFTRKRAIGIPLNRGIGGSTIAKLLRGMSALCCLFDHLLGRLVLGALLLWLLLFWLLLFGSNSGVAHGK